MGPPQFFPNDLTGPWGSSLIPNGSPGAGLPQPTGPPQSSSSPISPPRPPAPQGMALKPRLQTHSLGTRSLWGPQGLVPQPHSPAAARRRPSFWKAPGGGMQARNHMLPGGQPAARGGGSAHRAPILLATTLSPGNGEPCPDFLRRFRVLCRTLRPPKPLCPLRPGHLRLHKHLKPHGLGAVGAAVLDHPAHGQPADPRALLLPLPSVPRTGRARAVTPPGSGGGRGEGLDPHDPGPRSLCGTGPACRGQLEGYPSGAGC